MGNENGKMENGEMSDVDIAYTALGFSIIDPERKYAEVLSHCKKVSNSELIDAIIELIKYYNYVDLFKSGVAELSGMDAFAAMMDKEAIECLAEFEESGIPGKSEDMGIPKEVDTEKITKKLSYILSMNNIAGDTMNYETHSMFCKIFIKEFGFMPIIAESQRDINLDLYMSIVDAFNIYFAYIYESPENKQKVVISTDYYAILKNYMANQEQLHNEVIEHTKWLGMIEFAQNTLTEKIFGEDHITIPYI